MSKPLLKESLRISYSELLYACAHGSRAQMSLSREERAEREMGSNHVASRTMMSMSLESICWLPRFLRRDGPILRPLPRAKCGVDSGGLMHVSDATTTLPHSLILRKFP